MAVMCETLRLSFRFAKLHIFSSFKPIPQEDAGLLSRNFLGLGFMVYTGFGFRAQCLGFRGKSTITRMLGCC